jgi:hypothetical protein
VLGLSFLLLYLLTPTFSLSHLSGLEYNWQRNSRWFPLRLCPSTSLRVRAVTRHFTRHSKHLAFTHSCGYARRFFLKALVFHSLSRQVLQSTAKNQVFHLVKEGYARLQDRQHGINLAWTCFPAIFFGAHPASWAWFAQVRWYYIRIPHFPFRSRILARVLLFLAPPPSPLIVPPAAPPAPWLVVVRATWRTSTREAGFPRGPQVFSACSS